MQSRKKRNKQFFKEKELIRLKKESGEIWEAIHNQSLVELEKPIHHGYNAEWVLRVDISRRDDAHVYQEALDACKGMIWSKNIDFKRKNNKTRRWEQVYPELKKISKEKYDKLSPSAQKLFFESINTQKYWRYGFSDKEYRCTLTYELDILITKSYITHRREHDNILYQMDAETDKLLYQASNNPWGNNNSKPRFWRKHENTKDKLEAERKLVDAIKTYKGIKTKNDLLDI